MDGTVNGIVCAELYIVLVYLIMCNGMNLWLLTWSEFY